MSYPFWAAGVTYAVGDIVNSDPIAGEGAYAFRCKVAGTSGDDQPAFPLIFGSIVTDNQVTWEVISPVYEQLYKLEPEAIIELFHLRFTNFAANSAEVLSGSEKINVNGRSTDTWTQENLYFHAGTNGIPVSLVFNGITYTAAPVEADGFEKKVNGALPRPTLRVANVNNAITSLMHRSTNQINPLMAKVTRIRTCKKFIDAVNFFDQVYTFQDGNTAVTQGGDTLVFAAHGTGDGTARFPDEVWYIDRISSENQQLVEFELASKLELTNVLLPRRTVVEHCPWKYRGVECGYNGGAVAKTDDSSTTSLADDQCGKRLKSCRLRYPTAESLPFGGFPGARIHD
jgi:phage-related protein